MRFIHLFRQKVFLLFVLLLLGTYSYGQNPFSSYDVSMGFRDYWPASVSASGLFHKPAEEMDYARGRATVRIPLYEIRTADFVLPISLYFVTGGIEDRRPAGQLGAGWHLQAEPMISRQVRGAPDETYFLADSAVRYRSDNTSYRLSLATGLADIRQDIFHYRLLSGSSSFVLEESSHRYFRPRLLTSESVRISVPSGRVGSTFAHSIFITDPSGNRYVFGGESTSRERTFQGGGEAVTAWKASEVTSVHGDRLRFSYLSNAPQEYPSSRYDFYMLEDNYPNGEADDANGIPPHPGYWLGINGRKNYYYVSDTRQDRPTGVTVPVFKKWDKVNDAPYATPGSRVSPRPIERIDFAGGSVRFSYGSGSGLLERMEVYSGGNLLRSVRFTMTSTYLPFLTKVEMFGSDGRSTGCYRLGYTSYREGATEEEYTRWIGGESGDSSGDLVPTQQVTLSSGTDSRPLFFQLGNGSNAYFPDYRGEDLRFMVYPSGGRTEYDYEYGLAHTPVARRFRYGDTEALNGLGYTRFPAGASAFSEEYRKHYVVSGGLGKPMSGRCRLYCNRNLLSDDPSVYYPFVRESVNGVHTLRHFPCHISFNAVSLPRFPSPIGYDQVISREDSCVRFQGETPFSVRHSDYRTRYEAVGEIRMTALFENAGNVTPGGSAEATLRDLYLRSYQEKGVEVYQAESGEASHEEKRLDGNDITLRRETRSYSSTGLLQSITTDGERVEFTYPSSGASDPACRLMVFLNALSTPIETRHYVDGTLRKRLVEHYPSHLSCGKPSEVFCQDGRTFGIVWGYGGMHPVAFIEGMGAAAMLAAGLPLESTASSHTVSESLYSLLDRLRSTHPEARVTTFRYRPMVGLVCRTNPDGCSETYTYDACGRLSEIKNNQQENRTTYEYHEANQ